MKKVLKPLIIIVVIIAVAMFSFKTFANMKGITVKYFSDGQIFSMTKEFDIGGDDYDVTYDQNGNNLVITVIANVDIEYITVSVVYRNDQLLAIGRDVKTINDLQHGTRYTYSFDSSEVISNTSQIYNFAYKCEGKKIVQAHLSD